MHETVLGKDLTSDIAVTDQPPKTTSSKQRTLTEKYNINMKFQYGGNTTRVNLKFFIGFCFSVKHFGVNKCLSDTCIIENYSKAVKVSLLVVFAELKYTKKI